MHYLKVTFRVFEGIVWYETYNVLKNYTILLCNNKWITLKILIYANLTKKKKLLIQSHKLNVKIENKKTLVGCKQGHDYKEMKK